MPVLTQDLRRTLERAVERGRVVAEAAASSAVSRLGVGVQPAPGYLSESERVLRRGLRARARQLGDDVPAGDVTLLVREVAYEQWHRLLFARFLEVNGLLRHPEYGVSVSLAECEELAGELGEPDGWSVAGRFAAEILPGIFRPGDPSVQVRLATDDLVRLEEVVTGLSAEVFTAEDSLGWVYQFWQSRAKAEVNASGRKIGGADLSPVTQLFTENYMVRFLLDNSLGAWWAARHPDSPLVGGFEYLRFAEDGSPAAGSFEGWPGSVAEVTVMDPCCGSGHFLVAAFGMLWRMRAEEESLSPAAAQEAVLRDNLFGLELDPRCTQTAMFALALEAWKAAGYRQLPVPNVACSGIPAKAPLSEWTALAEGDPRVEGALARLHALFRDADTLGSLIDPVRAAEQAGLESVDWADIAPLVTKALAAETSDDPAAQVFGEAAAGIARAADLLSRTYTLIATNPPYLGINNHGEVLYGTLAAHHYLSRHDLALAMTDRLTALVGRRGCIAIVMPAEWLFVARLEDLRRDWLVRLDLNFVAALGYSAFKTTLRVNPALVIFGTTGSELSTGTFQYLDVGAAKDPRGKARGLVGDPLVPVTQDQQLSNPAAIVMPGGAPGSVRLDEFIDSAEGISTGDANRFERKFWEVDVSRDSWELLQDACSQTKYFAGRSDVLLWEKEQGQLAALAASVRHLNHAAQNWKRGKPYWGQRGIVINLLGHLRASLYTGDMFGKNCTVLIPRDQSLVPALWHFAASGELESTVRSFHSKMDISPGVLHKVPFDAERWRAVAEVAEPLPEPFSDDPTQWLFRGWPAGSASPLEVAVARLLGFRWPDQEPDQLDELADGDGIVCLPAVGGERPAADRLVELLGRAYGDDWSTRVLDGLLVQSGGKPGDLAGWLRDVFFKEHCRLFQNRPFAWHIWDGLRDGFSALVNYHRLDRATLEKLTYSTLGWWTARQRADADSGVTGADLRLAAAIELQRKLALILEGEPPYDIYVRWKSLAEQPIGWEPALDDGVRLNIRPFVEAGVLRSKFTIHWKKDRGTNPDGTERHNDVHLTIAEKRRDRGLA